MLTDPADLLWRLLSHKSLPADCLAFLVMLDDLPKQLRVRLDHLLYNAVGTKPHRVTQIAVGVINDLHAAPTHERGQQYHRH